MSTYTTIQSECLYNRSTYLELGLFDDFHDAVIAFNLPDLSGYTITAAELHANVSTHTATATVDAYCDVVGAWNESSSVGTISALSFNGLVDSQGVTGTGWYVWNILGDATKGIAKVYADDPTAASNVTVKLRINPYYDATAADSVATSIQTGMGLVSRITFDPRTDANFPYIVITYSATTNGGFVNILMLPAALILTTVPPFYYYLQQQGIAP